jgi:NAD+ synthase
VADEARRAEALVAWLRAQVEASGGSGLVVGLSGGIDSSVVAVLCARAFPRASLGLIMPCHSLPQDAEHAALAAAHAGLPVRTVDLSAAYDALLERCEQDGAEALRALARANLKPRLRMATLYFHANLLNYRVAGTGNRSELEVGYFTKYGDGGVDLLPLGGLVKTEVRRLAVHLGVPQPIIDKPPSAGLWAGQTDEGELGLTYDELDRYLTGGSVAPALAERVRARQAASRHKRALPPVAEV